MNPLSHTPAATASRSGRLATRGLPHSQLCGQQQPGMRSAGSRQYCVLTLLRIEGCALFAQHFICFGVDLLFVSCAQFALMFHLGGTGLSIPGVTSIRHRIFALLRQSKVFLWFRVLLRCCKFCHLRTSPLPVSGTQDSFVARMTSEGI